MWIVLVLISGMYDQSKNRMFSIHDTNHRKISPYRSQNRVIPTIRTKHIIIILSLIRLSFFRPNNGRLQREVVIAVQLAKRGPEFRNTPALKVTLPEEKPNIWLSP